MQFLGFRVWFRVVQSAACQCLSFVFEDLRCVGFGDEGLRWGLRVLGFMLLRLASVVSPNTRTETRDGFRGFEGLG